MSTCVKHPRKRSIINCRVEAVQKTERQNISLIEWLRVQFLRWKTHQKLSHTLSWWVNDYQNWKWEHGKCTFQPLLMTILLSLSFQWSLHNHDFFNVRLNFYFVCRVYQKGNVRRKNIKRITARHTIQFSFIARRIRTQIWNREWINCW